MRGRKQPRKSLNRTTFGWSRPFSVGASRLPPTLPLAPAQSHSRIGLEPEPRPIRIIREHTLAQASGFQPEQAQDESIDSVAAPIVFSLGTAGEIESQHGPSQPNRQAQADLNQLQSNISTSAGTAARGQTVTVTGNGFIPSRTPNGTTVLDGFGVFLPLPGQFGVSSEGPFADPNSTIPGQTWDTVTAAVGPPGEPGTPVAVSGPDGNGTVTVAVGTSGLQPGKYTVTITGDLLT